MHSHSHRNPSAGELPISWRVVALRSMENEMSRNSMKETFIRTFPLEDGAAFDRAVSWLDKCGFQVVEKEEAKARHPSVESTPADRAAADYKKQLALT